MNYEDFAISLINGSVTTEEFERIVQKQWQQGVIMVPLSIDVSAIIKERAKSSERLEYACPSFSNDFVFGTEDRPAGNLVRAPSDKGWKRPQFDSFIRPPHYHNNARIGIVTEGSSHFFVHVSQPENTDRVVAIPVYKNHIIFWPGGVVHTFATQPEPFQILSCTSNYARSDLEGHGLPAEVDFDAISFIGYYEYLALLKMQSELACRS